MKPYYEPAEMTTIPQLFPFTFELSSDLIFGSGAFEFGNAFGEKPHKPVNIINNDGK